MGNSRNLSLYSRNLSPFNPESLPVKPDSLPQNPESLPELLKISNRINNLKCLKQGKTRVKQEKQDVKGTYSQTRCANSHNPHQKSTYPPAASRPAPRSYAPASMMTARKRSGSSQARSALPVRLTNIPPKILPTRFLNKTNHKQQLNTWPTARNSLPKPWF